MMYGVEKSDSAIVAVKPANKAVPTAAEWVEPRAGTKGNMGQPTTQRTQSRESVSQRLNHVRKAARGRKKEKFTALLHHVTVDLLWEAFLALKRQAAPGTDGVTWEDYELQLEDNLKDLQARVQSGRYRAMPVKRRFIPKADGKQRPLGVTALDDKIVQRAVSMVLNQIYEEDFLGISYGFRPGHEAHRNRVAAQSPHSSPMARRTLCRQTPEVGAECPNGACSDLCGGRPAMGVPPTVWFPLLHVC